MSRCSIEDRSPIRILLWAPNNLLDEAGSARKLNYINDRLNLVRRIPYETEATATATRPSAPISVSQAVAAVHLAVTVMQWLNTGVVTAR
jgi:hypothetical protein